VDCSRSSLLYWLKWDTAGRKYCLWDESFVVWLDCKRGLITETVFLELAAFIHDCVNIFE
jgi:hypothetical protein